MSLKLFARHIKITFKNPKGDVDDQLANIYLTEDLTQFQFKGNLLLKEKEYLEDIDMTIDISKNLISNRNLDEIVEPLEDIDDLLTSHNFCNVTSVNEKGFRTLYYQPVQSGFIDDDDYQQSNFKINHLNNSLSSNLSQFSPIKSHANKQIRFNESTLYNIPKQSSSSSLVIEKEDEQPAFKKINIFDTFSSTNYGQIEPLKKQFGIFKLYNVDNIEPEMWFSKVV